MSVSNNPTGEATSNNVADDAAMDVGLASLPSRVHARENENTVPAVIGDDMDEDEDDLAAALELSMHPVDHDNLNEAKYAPNVTDKSTDSGKDDAIMATNNNEQAPKIKDDSDATEFDCVSFHEIMWDDAISTKNDKERWIYESISMGENSGPSAPPANPCTNTGDESKNNDLPPEITPLEIFTGSATPKSKKDISPNEKNEAPISSKGSNVLNQLPQHLWGLTQKHGGPCGVLAAIQAEIIRILIFGRKIHQKSNSDMKGKAESSDESRSLFFPFSPSENTPTGETNTAITQSEVDEALSMAIGIILARASITPSASDDFHSARKDGAHCVSLVIPKEGSGIILDGGNYDSEQKENVDELKPHAKSCWIREMLEDSSTNLKASAASKPSGLAVHTITTHTNNSNTGEQTSPTDKIDGNSNTENKDDASPDSKRQRPRKKEVTFSMDQDGKHDSTSSPSNNEQSAERQNMTVLAYKVADFLLGRDSTFGSNQNPPLDFFKGPGGVMYFVMSLVQSRGFERMQSDMDDPKTTITSQFGHSSQELINLLLTGQAVSNVFDNSITISAEYKCRGIQRRPAIGYLSQLESLRHCEVGGYYKSPLLPIWIIGSTSHFSVLFGDERCLKESSSDLLLEQCRRAFKKVEGGGDGFILAGNLGQVVDELDLRGKLGGDNGVHTLQAVLEVQGAGIILWDDFWKKASRLMTGSSLEHVLNDNSIDGGPPLLITQFGEKSASGPTAPSTMESDEELAKKLAAEWGTDNAVVDQGTKSDEDYARELQAQWDAERFGNSSSTGDNLLDLASQVAHVDDAESLSSSRPPSPVADYAVENGLGPAIFGDGYYNPTKFQPIADSTGENGFTPPNFGDGYYDPTKTLQPIADSTVENDSAPFGFNDVNALCKTELASARKTVQFAAQSKPQNFDFEDVKRKAERERFEVVSAMCKEAEARFAAQSKPQNFDFEKLGVSFPLYHYNGLRGGCLTPFRVTRLSPEEAVGASIALSSKGAGSGCDGGDLEDVVRTKWPSCMFNWLGKDPPYIG